MHIKLVKNGIFPVTKDLSGKPVKSGPATGFELPGTIQGEGKLAGIPVLFIRTSGCNLRCVWKTDTGKISICDTPYASHQPEETEEWQTDDIISILRLNLGNIMHVVISGGEPSIQAAALTHLARTIKKELHLHITLETNGVIFIPELAEWIDLFSISPKLKSSEPDRIKNKQISKPVEDAYIRDHRKFRKNIKTIQQYINACMDQKSYYGDEPDISPARKRDKDFQLKFVVSSDSDVTEIKNEYLKELNFVEKNDVLIMPVGENREILFSTAPIAARIAIRNGWRYSPRLQIDLFNDQRDV